MTTPHFTDQGAGRPVLLLHGGAGPRSVAGFAASLAGAAPARVIAPTHPGFDGTPRPDDLRTIAGLAVVYRELLDHLDLDDVTVVGNSVGGWIGAELALLGSPRVTGLVLVDAVGIEVPGEPVADVFALTPDELAGLSYHDPAKFRRNVPAPTEEQRAVMAANFATLRVYGGAMTDPGLRARLAGVKVPTLVAWGESDRICTPDYGRVWAAAIPDARFQLLTAAGHVPQLEDPEQLLRVVRGFLG